MAQTGSAIPLAGAPVRLRSQGRKSGSVDSMPITPTNPFRGRQFPGEVIMLCVRWYLRYPLAYEHVAELLAERGVEVDPSCIWRWVQVYTPELNKRCRPHLSLELRRLGKAHSPTVRHLCDGGALPDTGGAESTWLGGVPRRADR